MAVNDDTRASHVNALSVQRVGHHLLGSEQFAERAVVRKCDSVTQREFFFQRAIWWHPVIITSLKITNFRIKCAAHCDSNLLKSTANSDDWLASSDAFTDQWQRQSVAVAVKIAMRLRRLLAIFFGMYVGAGARKYKSVTQVHQLGQTAQR